MRLIWMPQALCQNYTLGRSYGDKCPYCPYSYDKRSNRLLFDNRLSVLNVFPAVEELIGFFCVNREVFGNHVTITGGEPLLYPHLAEVLNRTDYQFDPTSNTITPLAVLESLPLHRLAGCWTASYHPLSGNDEAFKQNVLYLKSRGAGVAITIVYSEQTREIMSRCFEFVQSLQPTVMQFHLDAHHDAEHLREEAARYGIPVYAGEPRRNRICRRHEDLMAVGPDGSLYECVTKMYQNLDPLGKVNEQLDVRSLPSRTEYCGLECFAVCDHIKHE